MKKMLTILLFFALVLSLWAAPLSRSGTVVRAEGEEAKKHLRIASTGTPTGVFNPLLVNDDYNMCVCTLVFDSLTNLSPSGEIEPKLAESWEISEDNKTFTLHLAKDAKWHDGEAVTAEDVKFTYEFLAHKDYAGPKASFCAPIKGYEEMKEGKAEELSGIKIIDEHTIEFTTEDIYAPFLSKTCFWIDIIPKHIWGAFPVADAEKQTELFNHPIGSGPFKMLEYVPDQYTTVVKNEEYWGGVPKLDEISYVIVNSDTSQAQLLNHEIDVLATWTMDPEVDKMMTEAGLKSMMNQPNAYQNMILNHDNKLLQNKYVRQALATAINRQGIVDALLYGKGAVANQSYPKTFWPYPGDEFIKPYDYSPEEAIRLLTEEAGWQYKDGVMFADGKPVEFRLTYPAGNKTRELSAPVIQENLQEIGIKVDLSMVEFATLLSMVQDKAPDSFDLVLMGHGIGEDADISTLIASDSGSNFMRWKNEEADKLLKAGKALLKIEERKPIYKELAILLNEEMPSVFLYNWQAPEYYWPNVEGMVAHPFSSSYNCLNWDLTDGE